MINNLMIIPEILLAHSGNNNVYEPLIFSLLNAQPPFSPSLELIIYPTTSPLRRFLTPIYSNAWTVRKHFCKTSFVSVFARKKTIW